MPELQMGLLHFCTFVCAASKWSSAIGQKRLGFEK